MRHNWLLVGVVFAVCLLLLANLALAENRQSPPDAISRVSIDVKDALVEDVLRLLVTESNAPIAITGEVPGRITLKMSDVPLEQVLDSIAGIANLRWWKSGAVYMVSVDKPPTTPANPSGNGSTTADSVPSLAQPGSSATSLLPPPSEPAPLTLPPKPRKVVWDQIKLQYADARDIAYLFGGAQSPNNPAYARDLYQPRTTSRIGEAVAAAQANSTPYGTSSGWPLGVGTQPVGGARFQYVPPPPPGGGVRTTPTTPGTATQPGQTGGALGNLLPEGMAGPPVAYEPLNILIVQGTQEAIDQLKDLIKALLDVKPKQVMIEAEFFEVSSNRVRHLGGLDWNWITKDFVVSATGIAPSAGDFQISFAKGNFQAVLRALKTHQLGRVINAPKVTTMNNFPASLELAQSFPYFTTNIVPGGFGGGNYTVRQLNFAPVITSLYIVPRINDDDSITTLIEPQVSDIVSLIEDPELGQIPQTSERRVRTMLRVKDGETIVMGGIVRRNETTSRVEVPILSQIPLLGNWLFTSRQRTYDDTELLIFLTPHVLHEEEEAQAGPSGLLPESSAPTTALPEAPPGP